MTPMIVHVDSPNSVSPIQCYEKADTVLFSQLEQNAYHPIVRSEFYTTMKNFCFLIGAIQLVSTDAFVSSNPSSTTTLCTLKSASDDHVDRSRRDSFASVVGVAFGGAAVLLSPAPALAAADCMKDCVKNCLLIAPKVSCIFVPKTNLHKPFCF